MKKKKNKKRKKKKIRAKKPSGYFKGVKKK